MDNEYLEHYGVPGMHWGVRKTRSGTTLKSKLSAKTINKKSSKKTKAVSSKQPSVKSLTDDELKARVARLLLEKQYSTLSPKQISKGKKAADFILNGMVLPAVKDAGKAYLTEQIKNGLTSFSEKSSKK